MGDQSGFCCDHEAELYQVCRTCEGCLEGRTTKDKMSYLEILK